MQGGGCNNGREVHQGKWVFEGLSWVCITHVHLNFSHDGYMESTMLLCVQARWHGKKIPFPFLWYLMYVYLMLCTYI
jgi:hypothetical protein